MRKMLSLACVCAWLSIQLMAAPVEAVDQNKKTGKVSLQSIGELAFGDDHSLFIGDSQQAAVFNIQLDDAPADTSLTEIKIEKIDHKIAQLLGTTPDQITMHDIAVHPKSQHVYISATRGQGKEAQPVLLRAAKDGALTRVALENVAFSKFELLKAPAVDAKDHRDRPLRTLSITEMRFHDNALYVSGLSNEEFASTLRKIPFPFNTNEKMVSLEVYHGAHGNMETHAPIRTFLHTKINEKDHLLASYTCTPLVTFSYDQLKNEAHVTGKTIAELGAGNVPLSMTSFEWEGQTQYLIANNRRGLMRISHKDVETYNNKPGMNTPSPEAWAAVGVPYLSVPVNGVKYLDKLNEEQTVLLARREDGTYDLDCGTRKIWMGIFD